jgi:hypothetical protein
MSKVTLYIKQKKFLYALLRNSIYIPSDRDVETIPIAILKNILSKHGISYVKEYIDDESSIIVTDDILIANRVTNKKIIFIPPVDYNVIDGFVMELQQSDSSIVLPTESALDYLEKRKPNLKLLSPVLLDHPNLIFDLSVVLNYNLHDDKWGKIHYSAKNLFSAITHKPYRIDYSIREVRKINRIELFLKLIDSNLNDTIKLNIHNLFLEEKDMYELTKQYFHNLGHSEYFERIISLDTKYYSSDLLFGGHYTHQSWPVGKLVNHTLKSDISMYHESAPEEDDFTTMDYLITEKTIDLLSIGKPFIHNSKIVDDFNTKYGFVNYNKSVFRNLGKDKIEIIEYISNLSIMEYGELITTLNKLAQQNLKKLEDYKCKNTFLSSLIHN